MLLTLLVWVLKSGLEYHIDEHMEFTIAPHLAMDPRLLLNATLFKALFPPIRTRPLLFNLYNSVDEYIMARHMQRLEQDKMYIKMTEKHWELMQRYLNTIHHCLEVQTFAVTRQGQEEQINGWTMENLVLEHKNLGDRAWNLLVQQEAYRFQMVTLRVERIDRELSLQDREKCRPLEDEFLKYGICG